MPRLSAFIFEIRSENDNLKKDIITHCNRLKIDLNKRLPWEGFVPRPNGTLFYQDYNRGTENLLKLNYGIEEIVPHKSMNSQTYNNRVRENVEILINISNNLLFIFTSNAGLANRVVRKFSQPHPKGNSLIISPKRYSIEFIKWLEKIEDYENSRLINIDGTRAINLSDVDGISDSLSLRTHDRMNKSDIFDLIKDKGSRIYLKGKFKILRKFVSASFYTNCKVTISSKQSKFSEDETKEAFKFIHHDLQGWFRRWNEENANQ